MTPKIVDFSFCAKCIHEEEEEFESPCHECLNVMVRSESRVPLHFEKNKKIKPGESL